MNHGHHFLLSLLFLYLVHYSAQANRCPPFFKCGSFGYVGFPFSEISNPECGLIRINCSAVQPKVQFRKDGKWYLVEYLNSNDKSMWISDEEIQTHLKSNKCDLLRNFTDKATPPLYLKVSSNHPYFKCKRPYSISPHNFFTPLSNYTGCSDYDLYFYDNSNISLPFLPEKLSESCSRILSSHRAGGLDSGMSKDHDSLLQSPDFVINWDVSKTCTDCYEKGGKCQFSTDYTWECSDLPKGDRNVGLKIKIGAGAGIGALILTIVFFLYWKCHSSLDYIAFWKHKGKSQKVVEEFLKSYGSLAPKRYSYHDIKKITSSFKEKIGEGGFGCVYKGKLVDGRVVAGNY